MPEGGQLRIETGNAELPRLDSMASYVTLNIAHTGQDPDLEKLFEPSSIAEDGLALAMVHGIVIEHGGYISAQATSRGCRFELLFPRAVETLAAGAGSEPREVPTVLLVDYRERVRAQLHNFFEAEGYNLLEAVDDQEALALGDVHEGSLDLLVAEGADAERIGAALRKNHPGLQVLRIVDRLEPSGNQICRPFTQTALLEKASQLLAAQGTLGAAATSS
jgi:CheY-like chemotaxis protein